MFLEKVCNNFFSCLNPMFVSRLRNTDPVESVTQLLGANKFREFGFEMVD